MKVVVDIEQSEAQAFVELLKDAKMPAEMGYVLTSLKFKIFQAFKKADESIQLETAKKMLIPEKSVKTEVKRVTRKKNGK